MLTLVPIATYRVGAEGALAAAIVASGSRAIGAVVRGPSEQAVAIATAQRARGCHEYFIVLAPAKGGRDSPPQDEGARREDRQRTYEDPTGPYIRQLT